MTLIHNKIKELDFSDECKASLINFFDGNRGREVDKPYSGETPHQRQAKTGNPTHIINDVYAVAYPYRKTDLRATQELIQFISKPSAWRPITKTEKFEALQKAKPVEEAPKQMTKKEIRRELRKTDAVFSNRTSHENLIKLAQEHGIL